MSTCEICRESVDTFKCTKCEQVFCFTHLKTHRDQLILEICQVQDEINAIRQKIYSQKENLSEHPLHDFINQWENESIRKIRQMADRTRKSLINRSDEYISNLEKHLNDLSTEVQQFSRKKICDKIQMTRWNEKLAQFNVKMNPLETIEIDELQRPLVKEIEIFFSSRNTKWSSNGVSIAGNRGNGERDDQFNGPWSLFIDENQTMLIADSKNNRIMNWRTGMNSGRVVAGGNGQGNRLDQLMAPSDAIVHKESNSLLICDSGNRRIMQWPHYDHNENSHRQGKILIDNIDCAKIFADDRGYFYVSDCQQHCVKRYRIGDENGIVVAGGNGKGDGLNQLNNPNQIFVDRDFAVYVSDFENHRVMKWPKEAKQGTIVAGGQGQGNRLSQLNRPKGLWIDRRGDVYVSDCLNDRIMRWKRDAKQGTLLVGGNGQGSAANQLYYPQSIAFDLMDRLYVADWGNERVQVFSSTMLDD